MLINVLKSKKGELCSTILFIVIASFNLQTVEVGYWSLSLIPIFILLNKRTKISFTIVSIILLGLLQFSVELSTGFVTLKEITINYMINCLLIIFVSHQFNVNSKKQEKDELTKAFNRKFYNRVVNSYKKMSLTMIDIDHFKNINDTYGHQAGDFVLSKLVSVIEKGTRKNDKIIRLGGEEFCIISTFTDELECKRMADRVRRLISKEKFVYKGVEIPVTISAGISVREKNEHPKSFAERADQALYKAKRNGRNQISFG